MDEVISQCKNLTVDQIESAIKASSKAGVIDDPRAFAAYLKSKAG